MFICRSRGFIFLRVPKTASSSISAHLCDNIEFDHNRDAYSSFMGRGALNIHNLIDANNEHATIKNFLHSGLLNDNDIRFLKIYAVLREPIERTISMFSHVLSNFENKNTSQMSSNEILDQGLKLFHSSPRKYFYSRFANDPNNKRFYPLLPQSNWLYHYDKEISNIIVYPKFSKFLFDLTSQPNLKHKHKQSGISLNTNVDLNLIKELKKIYPQDFVLWQKYGVN